MQVPVRLLFFYWSNYNVVKSLPGVPNSGYFSVIFFLYLVIIVYYHEFSEFFPVKYINTSTGVIKTDEFAGRFSLKLSVSVSHGEYFCSVYCGVAASAAGAALCTNDVASI